MNLFNLLGVKRNQFLKTFPEIHKALFVNQILRLEFQINVDYLYVDATSQDLFKIMSKKKPRSPEAFSITILLDQPAADPNSTS
jgi:hypothetical protein